MATSITKPQVLQQPFCNSGDKNSIPSAATGSNLASLAEGFPAITSLPIDDGGEPPDRKDFNGIGNLLSQFYFAFQNGWWPTFDSDVSTAIGGYASGAVLWYETGKYFVRSVKNNNTDNFVTDPAKIDGVSWEKIGASWGNIAGTLSNQTDLQNALNGKQDTSNLVTALSNASTDAQYPSAKCVYDIVGDIETALQTIRGV